jgi:DNA-binding XRE family transcriptional regulator
VNYFVKHWREVYPDYGPADALRGARIKKDLTQRALAALMGISQRHISEMENVQ